MPGRKNSKLSGIIDWVGFKVGGVFFPLFEPVFRVRENWDSEVKKHFHQAIRNLEENRMTVALLNLNMVLSIEPRHFLARVYRGRIYLQGNHYRQASEDYLQANRINSYRFVHYRLGQEYFASVKNEFGELGTSITKNFDQLFEVLRQSQGGPVDKGEMDETQELLDQHPDYDDYDLDVDIVEDGKALNDPEYLKFKEMGPISKQEIEETDWDKVIKQLTS
jgi:tetratricopeptide (TPR) repeat protein